MAVVEDALEQTKLRNKYYRDNYRRVVFALIVMLFVSLSLIGVIIYQFTTREEPRYFATSADGKISPLTPSVPPNRGV